MPFIPVPNAVTCIIKATLDGANIINNLSFNWTGGGSFLPADLTALGAAVNSWIHAELVPFQTNILGYLSIDVVDQTTNPGMIYTEILGYDGSLSSTAVPNQVAMTVTLQTGVTGRSNRGRFYVAGLPTSALQDQRNWKATEVANLDGAFAALPGSLGALTWNHGVISRYHNGAPRSPGIINDVATYRANGPLTTQRRRLR